MCRLTLYLGPPVRMAAVVTEPSHSLVHQSHHSIERSDPVNGDGFGVGWYAPEVADEPAVFRSITPAWNNQNLRQLTRVVASPCILAHVRAATAGLPVSEVNCHPFQHGRLLFMHNGELGDFHRLRRRLLAKLSDEAFRTIRGGTDSEHLFALFVDEFARVRDPDPSRRLARALNRTVWTALRLADEVGIRARTALNLVVADGRHAAACRVAHPHDRSPESLYLHTGGLFRPHTADSPDPFRGDAPIAAVIASERLTGDAQWSAVRPGELVSLSRDRHPVRWQMRPEALVPVGVSCAGGGGPAFPDPPLALQRPA